MRRNNLRVWLWLIGCCFLAAGWTQGFAAEKSPYYGGKTLTFVINFAAGGPTDIEGRVFAEHLGRHIPGQPAIVVQNRGGGGGMAGVNFIGEVAETDGLTAGYFLRRPVA